MEHTYARMISCKYFRVVTRCYSSPDHNKHAAVLASGKAGRRPPMRCRARGPVARPPLRGWRPCPPLRAAASYMRGSGRKDGCLGPNKRLGLEEEMRLPGASPAGALAHSARFRISSCRRSRFPSGRWPPRPSSWREPETRCTCEDRLSLRPSVLCGSSRGSCQIGRAHV